MYSISKPGANGIVGLGLRHNQATVTDTEETTVRNIPYSLSGGESWAVRYEIYGNNFSNKIAGGGANDCIRGQAGNDVLSGGGGNDLLFGDTGNDTLMGGIGNDALNGGAHNDSLNGGAGNDNVIGGAGSDVIIGGAGADVLTGGAENDTFRFSATDAGGEVFDVITDLSAGDRIDFSAIWKGDWNIITGVQQNFDYLPWTDSFDMFLIWDGGRSTHFLVYETLPTNNGSNWGVASGVIIGGDYGGLQGWNAVDGIITVV